MAHESRKLDEPLVLVFDEFPYAAEGLPSLPPCPAEATSGLPTLSGRRTRLSGPRAATGDRQSLNKSVPSCLYGHVNGSIVV